MSVIGVKTIQYPDGPSSITINSSGNVSMPGTLSVTGAVTAGSVAISDDNNYSFGDGTTYIQGSGAADRLKFITNASEAMRIDSSGKVGIGTSSPVSMMHLEGDTPVVTLRDTSAYSAGTGSYIQFQGKDSGGTNVNFGQIHGLSLTSNNGVLAFYTRSGGTTAERVRITDVGRVGIGTSIPDEKLDVRGTIQVGVDGTTAGEIRFMDSGSVTEEATISSDANGGLIFGGNSGPGELIFRTGSSTERMRIDSSGNVGIGTASPNGNGLLTINAPTNNSPQIVFTENDTAKWLIGHRHDGDHFRFYDLANSAERMRIDASGKVGINETAPLGTLHVRTSDASITSVNANSDDLIIENNGNCGITIASSTTGEGMVSFVDSGDTNIGRIQYQHNINQMNFRVNDAERMRINSAGNITVTDGSIASGVTHTFNLFGATGTGGSANYVTYSFVGDPNTGMFSGTADTLKFATGGSERMRIESNGEVGIGTTSPNAQLEVSSPNLASTRDALRLKNQVTNTGGYFIRFENSTGGVAGYVEQTGQSSVSYTTSSDYRLKENIVDLNDATTRIKQLQPKRFNFITEPNTTLDGFLAHEVQSVVPEAVSGTKDAVDEQGNIKPQGIDQSKLVPLLVKTIQELEARITALENT